MKKKCLSLILLLSICVFSFQRGFSQGDPDNLAKSLVKITIAENGNNIIAASGFVWQRNDYVVTSLHVMRPGINITIKLNWSGDNRGVWNARVIKVHPSADLVLLQVIPGDIGLPAWTPITTKGDSKQLKFSEEIFALGYNHGANGWSTKTLKKGVSQSAKLADLIPDKDVVAVKKLGMPSIDLDIIYLEGSLLPGFSGSPIVNRQGLLIGIGDGGLENGASNVSWGIPASQLDALLVSNQSTLPLNIGHASQTFSAEINNPEYKTLQYGQYNFVHTKTRTLEELIESLDEPERIIAWFEDIKNMHLDFSLFVYDIYEDVNYGVIITVPQGQNLSIEQGELRVQFESKDYYLSYVTKAVIGDYNRTSLASLKNYYSDFYTSKGFIVKEDLEEDTIIENTAGNILSTAALYINDAAGENILQYVYYKTAFNKQTSLTAISSLYDCNTRNLDIISKCSNAGINCTELIHENSICQNSCSLVYKWYYILTSVNLTGFANK